MIIAVICITALAVMAADMVMIHIRVRSHRSRPARRKAITYPRCP